MWRIKDNEPFSNMKTGMQVSKVRKSASLPTFILPDFSPKNE